MGYAALTFAAVFLALWAFTAWFKTRAEDRYPPLGEFVEVDGLRLHYVDKGAGPPVVLLHGASGNLRDMTISLVDPLAENHRVIAFDRPGHGWSERPEGGDAHSPAVQAGLLHRALQKLGIEKPVLLGHSLGGAVAMTYALEHGDSLAGVIALAAPTQPWEEPVAWYHAVVRTPVVGWAFLRTLMVPGALALKGPGIAGTFRPNKPVEDYGERIGLDLAFRPRAFRFNSADVDNLNAFLSKQTGRWETLTLPVIVIHGTADYTVGAKRHGYALHNQVPGSELIKLRGVGHMPHHVMPEPIVDAVARLARGETPKAGETVYEYEN